MASRSYPNLFERAAGPFPDGGGDHGAESHTARVAPLSRRRFLEGAMVLGAAALGSACLPSPPRPNPGKAPRVHRLPRHIDITGVKDMTAEFLLFARNQMPPNSIIEIPRGARIRCEGVLGWIANTPYTRSWHDLTIRAEDGSGPNPVFFRTEAAYDPSYPLLQDPFPQWRFINCENITLENIDIQGPNHSRSHDLEYTHPGSGVTYKVAGHHGFALNHVTNFTFNGGRVIECFGDAFGAGWNSIPEGRQWCNGIYLSPRAVIGTRRNTMVMHACENVYFQAPLGEDWAYVEDCRRFVIIEPGGPRAGLVNFWINKVKFGPGNNTFVAHQFGHWDTWVYANCHSDVPGIRPQWDVNIHPSNPRRATNMHFVNNTASTNGGATPAFFRRVDGVHCHGNKLPIGTNVAAGGRRCAKLTECTPNPPDDVRANDCTSVDGVPDTGQYTNLTPDFAGV